MADNDSMPCVRNTSKIGHNTGTLVPKAVYGDPDRTHFECESGQLLVAITVEFLKDTYSSEVFPQNLDLVSWSPALGTTGSIKLHNLTNGIPTLPRVKRNKKKYLEECAYLGT